MIENTILTPTIDIDKVFKPFSRTARTLISIDAANLYRMEQALNIRIDYIKFKQLMEHYFEISSLNYFTSKPMEHNTSVMTFHNFLSYNGYRVHYKPISVRDEEDGPAVNKTNVDVHMAVETLRNIYTDKSIDQLIIVSGDSDFISLINAVKHSVRCGVMSTEFGYQQILSRSLRKSVDGFIELGDIASIIKRNDPPELIVPLTSEFKPCEEPTVTNFIE